MEYFLFGVTEADRLIEQLKHMEIRINKLMDEQDELENSLQVLKQDKESLILRQKQEARSINMN